jgi:hypothetical protein
MPEQRNGYMPIETAHLHADYSDCEWGAVMNGNLVFQGRGFWYKEDHKEHMTW